MLDLRGSGADPDVLAPAVEHLRSGGVVAHPTETVYGLGGVATSGAVARVAALKGRESGKPFIALVGAPSWVSGLAWTDAARELAEVFWPGALTLVLRDPTGIFPRGVRSDSGTVAVRVSPHPVVAALLAAVGSPLTSTSANVPGGRPRDPGRRPSRSWRPWEGATTCWSSTPARCASPPLPPSWTARVPSPSSFVRGRCRWPDSAACFRRSMEPNQSDRQPFRLLFVCTGNTCRSPMAEALARRALARRGWTHVDVASAGVAAFPGAPASEGARNAARRRGLDLEEHRSTPLTRDLLERQDVVLAMTHGHLQPIDEAGFGERATLLTSFAAGVDDPAESEPVMDPFGGPDQAYDATLVLLEGLIDAVLDRLEPVVAP